VLRLVAEVSNHQDLITWFLEVVTAEYEQVWVFDFNQVAVIEICKNLNLLPDSNHPF
jgi:hypothetical protein